MYSTWRDRERETERETERERDRQTDRQTDRQSYMNKVRLLRLNNDRQ